MISRMTSPAGSIHAVEWPAPQPSRDTHETLLPQLSIVIPTRDEAGNIDELMRRLAGALPAETPAEVVFVDDSSDGTPDAIRAAARLHPIPVMLIHRARPEGGLGGAVVEGLRAARAPWAVVMDGDLQHPPALIPELLAATEPDDVDLVVAIRRDSPEGRSGLDGRYRRVVSRTASALAGVALGKAVAQLRDPMSGFFAVRKSALALDEARPLGYKVLLELAVRFDLARVARVPYDFGPRFAGRSKSTAREGVRYLRHLLRLRRIQRHSRAPGRVARSMTGDRMSRGTASSPGRLRILLITSEAPPIVSGISRCVDRLAAGLRAKGHQVDVLSSVQMPRLSIREWRFSSLAAFLPSLAGRLGEYDIVNLHGPVPTMSDVFLIFRMLARGATPPILYTHHSALAIRGAAWACAVYNRLHRVLAVRSNMVLATSTHYADLHRTPGGPPVRVVPWGVDVRPPPPPAARRPGPTRVLFVGQMRGYKGIEWLLPAVAGRPEIELTLVGAGAHLHDYQRLAANLGGTNVRFVGRLTDRDLHEEYDRSDIIVLPSVTTAEAFGLVVLEGMSARCVPVVSDLPGVRDLVSGVGVVVPPRDAAALQEALLSLAADPDRLDRLAGQARDRAEELSWERCVDRYEEALTEVVHNRLQPSTEAPSEERRTALPARRNGPVRSGPAATGRAGAATVRRPDARRGWIGGAGWTRGRRLVRLTTAMGEGS